MVQANWQKTCKIKDYKNFTINVETVDKPHSEKKNAMKTCAVTGKNVKKM